MNKAILIGRLTRDPELRYTSSNRAVCQFTVAIDRPFTNQASGTREADFINCVIWRQQAENLSNWAKKGTLVGITGRIQTRHYENQQGQRVYVTEVIADNFQILESRATREGQSGGSYNSGYNNQPSFGDNSHDSGFSSQPSQQTPNFGRDESPFGNSNPMDISDDDLPF